MISAHSINICTGQMHQHTEKGLGGNNGTDIVSAKNVNLWPKPALSSTTNKVTLTQKLDFSNAYA